MTQEIKITVKDKDYQLQIQPDKYNGRPVYYILNDNISSLFDHALPDHLMLMENGTGFTSSPRLSEMEGGYILEKIWEAITKSNKSEA